MPYTYAHYTADTDKLFYIGKGVDRRYKRKISRNKYWHNIVNKHGFVAKILAHWETEKEALQHEELLISVFKDMGYKLANLTNGGESGVGYVMPLEEREKRKNYKHTEEAKKKISLASKNFWKSNPVINKNYITEEYKQKKREISLNNGNKPPIGSNKKPVKCIETNEIFESAKKAGMSLNKINGSLIIACCKKKINTAYKLHWEYV